MTAPVLRPAFAHLTGDEAMQAIRFKDQVQALRDDNARQAKKTTKIKESAK